MSMAFHSFSTLTHPSYSLVFDKVTGDALVKGAPIS